jgi:predicted metal-dependent phosphoesterase TrpH
MTRSTAAAPNFELQSHSTHSDGELSPAAVVKKAAEAGVELLALTDHDTIAGVGEATNAAVGLGLRLVSGVEISVLDPVAGDLHMCGYLIDPANAALKAQLARSRGDRERRAHRMIEALEKDGWHVEHEQLATRLADGGTLGRPHLAEAVIAHPDNAARLGRERLTNSSEFLEAYLIEGRPAFREREAPSVAEAIELVHGAGGVAVWAHPFWDVAGDGEVLATLERFVGLGLDGVEAFYVTHTQAQTDLLVRRCEELELLTTGSSDFHGPHHAYFSQFRRFSTFGHAANLGPIA